MTNDKFDNLVRIGQLKAEPASEEEISGLLRSGGVRLADAKNEDLSKESRFDLAYKRGARIVICRVAACWLSV